MSDFDLTHWFPAGTRHVHVSVIPATNFALRNAYTIVTCAIHSHPSINNCLQQTLGLYVRGNILVFRHSARRQLSVINVHNAERRLIDLVLHRYGIHTAMFTTNQSTALMTHQPTPGATDSS